MKPPLAPHQLFALHRGDALAWLRTLPDWYVDVWITSPPYELARTYGLTKKHIKKGEEWVEWYVPFCLEMARSGRIVVINAAGQCRQWKYSPVMEWLIADLTRRYGLVVGPSPYAWVKSSGTPGSGQRHYHRRNWEPCYVIGLPAAFPPAWSNNLAFGAPPKHKPGGEFSNRMANGKRVNASSRMRQGSGRTERKIYKPPKIANPGNVIFTGNGGNQLGSKVAHKTDAPMNLIVAERFVRWYARPGSVVGDPMCGSGTTLHAALKWGRRALGCDIRPGEILKTQHRLASVTLAGV